jgi:endoglycosylceramidase
VQAAFQNFWSDKKGPGGVGVQERYVQVLKEIATTFRHDPAVLGYDLFNEPWEGWQKNEADCESATGCPDLEQSLLGPFYVKAAKAVRAADPKHLVFAEPFLTFDYTGGSSLPAYGQPMNGLSFHPYVMGQLPNAIGLAQSNGDALLVTEFGATTSLATIKTDLTTLDGSQLPWIFWDYEGHASSTQRRAMQTLAEPYPFATAGTPTSYSFDWASKTFHLTYTTTAVDDLNPAAQTVIEIPPTTYPRGYSVSAQGAVVTSKPCATHLTLRASANLRPAAPSITVTVSPAGTGADVRPQRGTQPACRAG